MLKQGTMSDRISALSTIIQKDPQSSLSYIQNLIGMSKKKNRKQVEVAINQLRDLFCDILLHDDRKLSPFSKNPELLQAAKSRGKVDNTLILQAYFEHHLKELYSDFIIGVLKPMTHDDLEFYRKFGLNTL